MHQHVVVVAAAEERRRGPCACVLPGAHRGVPCMPRWRVCWSVLPVPPHHRRLLDGRERVGGTSLCVYGPYSSTMCTCMYKVAISCVGSHLYPSLSSEWRDLFRYVGTVLNSDPRAVIAALAASRGSHAHVFPSSQYIDIAVHVPSFSERSVC